MTAFERAWDVVKSPNIGFRWSGSGTADDHLEDDDVCPKCGEPREYDQLCWDCELCHDCCDCAMVASWDGQSEDVDWERERRKIP